MTRKSQIMIDQIYSYANFAVTVLICSFLFLGGLGLIPSILNHYDVWANHYDTTYYACVKPILVILGIVIIAIALLGILIRPFITERKDERDAENIDSPLKGMSKDQENIIIKLLKDRGKPEGESGKMKRSEVAYILNALMELGYIDPSCDIDTLRLWAIKSTGYKEDDKNHFVESMDRCRKNNKALKTKEMIKEKLTSNNY